MQCALKSGAVHNHTFLFLHSIIRGVELYRKLHVPLLGMVENMSCYVCKSCGHHEYIFGEGGAVRTAQELGLRVLGQVGGWVAAGCGAACAGKGFCIGDLPTDTFPFLVPCIVYAAQVPLDIAIRVRSDGGAPVVVSEPASSSAKAYIDIARNVYQALQEGSQGTKGPKISVE
jgi:ATP-binding protein involved in chromosome partitioning